MKSKKQAVQEKRQRARMTARLAWGGALLVVLSLAGYLVWTALRPQPGAIRLDGAEATAQVSFAIAPQADIQSARLIFRHERE